MWCPQVGQMRMPPPKMAFWQGAISRGNGPKLILFGVFYGHKQKIPSKTQFLTSGVGYDRPPVFCGMRAVRARQGSFRDPCRPTDPLSKPCRGTPVGRQTPCQTLSGYPCRPTANPVKPCLNPVATPNAHASTPVCTKRRTYRVTDQFPAGPASGMDPQWV